MRGKSNNDSGATMPETAISILFFLFLVLAGIQLMVIAYHGVAIQFLVSEAANIAALNSCQPAANCAVTTGSFPGTTAADKRAYYVWKWLVENAPKWDVPLLTSTSGSTMIPDPNEIKVKILPLSVYENATASQPVPDSPVYRGGSPGIDVITIELKRKEHLFFDSLCNGACTMWLRGIAVARLERLAK